MTSDHLDDETLSASLDGEATAAELTHLGGCDLCEGRVGELRRAAALIGGPVAAPDHERRDAAIRTAVSAAPTVLATRRRMPPAWLAAAAAFIVLAAFAALLVQGSGGGQDDADTAAGSFDAESERTEESDGGDAASDEPAATGGGSAAQSAPAPAAAPDPGSAALAGDDVGSLDGDLLRAVVERRVRAVERDAAADDTATSTTAAAPCESELRAVGPPLGSVRFVGRGTLEGAAALLVVFDVPDEDAVLAFAVSPPDCTVLRTESVPAT